jgi:ABC-type nitrate/sulfonate/bicarbonate transport system permease component
VIAEAPAEDVSAATAPPSASSRSIRTDRTLSILLPVVSVVAALVLWELISRTGVISQRDLPSMSTAFRELWSLMTTRGFWIDYWETVRGWLLGIVIATVLAVPTGIVLGSSDFLGSAFRVPIEFLRPIPSAALIPVLFLSLGTNLKSEVFLATFGAFWPLLVQTIYGVRDVDPVTTETGRSFGLGRAERLYRITLPSAVPYIWTGLRIASTVALILAFTAELFMGTGGLGERMNVADAFGLTSQVYALALAIGFLGIGIHLALSALERRILHWHPSQRISAP